MTGPDTHSAAAPHTPGLRPWTFCLLALSVLLSACGSSDEGQEQGQSMPSPPVTVETVNKTRVDIDERYAGRVRGAREVAVMTRVDGVLKERLYEEGQVVKKGEPLFLIHPEPFEVELQAAEAQKQRAKADLNQAEREWQRVSRLYKQNAVSERERDRALSALEMARAAMAVARADINRAKLMLSYTRVEAPISGVTSLETLSEGTLLERGTELTRMTQMDPVHVRFAIPESDATLQREARRALSDSDRETPLREATLILSDGEEYEHTGVVDFTASTIDPRTGTVSARAVFDNPQQRVVPGEFVRVRMTLETLENVVLLPARALGDGPDGRQVFVVDDENKAHARSVQTGRTVDGQTLILGGLEEGERVVVNGIAALRQDGMEVEVSGEGKEEGKDQQDAGDDEDDGEADGNNGQKEDG